MKNVSNLAQIFHTRSHLARICSRGEKEPPKHKAFYASMSVTYFNNYMLIRDLHPFTHANIAAMGRRFKKAANDLTVLAFLDFLRGKNVLSYYNNGAAIANERCAKLIDSYLTTGKITPSPESLP